VVGVWVWGRGGGCVGGWVCVCAYVHVSVCVCCSVAIVMQLATATLYEHSLCGTLCDRQVRERVCMCVYMCVSVRVCLCVSRLSLSRSLPQPQLCVCVLYLSSSHNLPHNLLLQVSLSPMCDSEMTVTHPYV